MEKVVFIAGPDPKLKLIYSDVWLPGLYSRRILCFALPDGSSHTKTIDVVERGLLALVQGTPELGGVVEVIPPHGDTDPPWRAITRYRGLEFVVRDMTKSFPSLSKLKAAGFPLSAFKDKDLMPVPITIQPEPRPVCKVQLTLIEEGALVSFCAYHSFTDGNGMNVIMRALGEACRQAGESAEALPPRVLETDRSILSTITGSQQDILAHPAYKIMPGACLPPGYAKVAARSASGDAQHQPEPEMVFRCYRLEHEQAGMLKKAASELRPISTHDAISALMWRTLIDARVKAGRLEDSAVTTYTVPHNARKHVGLSKDWVGNCVYFVAPDMRASDVVKEGSLAKLASAMRASLDAVDKEIVGGIMEMRKSGPYDIIWWPIVRLDEPAILGITSFYHSDLYGSDWGSALGKVQHFTTSDEGAVGSFRRALFVGPKLPGGSGCDVLLGVDTDELRYIEQDDLWHKYFRPVPA